MTEGERWARDELDVLLAHGLTPKAWARFLAAAQRRTNAQRAARPEAAARLRAWVGVGALAYALPAAAGVQPFRRRRRDTTLWWGLTALMLDWHVGMLESEDGEAREPGPADALTLVRVWLVPVVLDGPTPVLVAVAGVTDVLDGVVARATVPTRAGRDLEGLADAAFSVAALRGAIRRGQLHRRVAAVEAARLSVGLGYALAVTFGTAAGPNPAVLRAGRLAAPVRAAGLLLAAGGHRRAGERVLAAGSVLSMLPLLRARAAAS